MLNHVILNLIQDLILFQHLLNVFRNPYKLILRNLTSLPQLVSVIREPRHDMEVRMEHDLPGERTVVHPQIKTVGPNSRKNRGSDFLDHVHKF